MLGMRKLSPNTSGRQQCVAQGMFHLPVRLRSGQSRSGHIFRRDSCPTEGIGGVAEAHDHRRDSCPTEGLVVWPKHTTKNCWYGITSVAKAHIIIFQTRPCHASLAVPLLPNPSSTTSVAPSMILPATHTQTHTYTTRTQRRQTCSQQLPALAAAAFFSYALISELHSTILVKVKEAGVHAIDLRIGGDHMFGVHIWRTKPHMFSKGQRML